VQVRLPSYRSLLVSSWLTAVWSVSLVTPLSMIWCAILKLLLLHGGKDWLVKEYGAADSTTWAHVCCQ
jgi:hypothetical protein